MDFKTIIDTVVLFVREHQAWAPLICGLLAFAESLAIISLLVPATGILLALGLLLGSAGLDFWPIFAASAIGAMLGDWVSYAIARHYNYAVFGIWPLSRHPEMVKRGECFVRRYGILAIFFGRFFGPFRAIVLLFAGIFEMPLIPFQIANVASAIVWAFGILAPGTGLAWFLNW